MQGLNTPWAKGPANFGAIWGAIRERFLRYLIAMEETESESISISKICDSASSGALRAPEGAL